MNGHNAQYLNTCSTMTSCACPAPDTGPRVESPPSPRSPNIVISRPAIRPLEMALAGGRILTREEIEIYNDLYMPGSALPVHIATGCVKITQLAPTEQLGVHWNPIDYLLKNDMIPYAATDKATESGAGSATATILAPAGNSYNVWVVEVRFKTAPDAETEVEADMAIRWRPDATNKNRVSLAHTTAGAAPILDPVASNIEPTYHWALDEKKKGGVFTHLALKSGSQTKYAPHPALVLSPQNSALAIGDTRSLEAVSTDGEIDSRYTITIEAISKTSDQFPAYCSELMGRFWVLKPTVSF